jgi:Tfp pilus assembly protein PilF
LIELKRYGENTAEAARQEFEEVLQIEPRFAPAYIGLATLALSERDINQAHKYWLEAQRTNAFNHFVMDFRTQVEEIMVTCERVEQ